MIKTCIENSQNLIVEGCYIPFGWEKDFSFKDLLQIKYICLIFSRNYIENYFDDILRFEKIIEKRLSSDVILDEIIKTNEYNLEQCVSRNYNHILIDDTYQIDIDCIWFFDCDIVVLNICRNFAFRRVIWQHSTAKC